MASLEDELDFEEQEEYFVNDLLYDSNEKQSDSESSTTLATTIPANNTKTKSTSESDESEDSDDSEQLEQTNGPNIETNRSESSEEEDEEEDKVEPQLTNALSESPKESNVTVSDPIDVLENLLQGYEHWESSEESLPEKSVSINASPKTSSKTTPLIEKTSVKNVSDETKSQKTSSVYKSFTDIFSGNKTSANTSKTISSPNKTSILNNKVSVVESILSVTKSKNSKTSDTTIETTIPNTKSKNNFNSKPTLSATKSKNSSTLEPTLSAPKSMSTVSVNKTLSLNNNKNCSLETTVPDITPKTSSTSKNTLLTNKSSPIHSKKSPTEETNISNSATNTKIKITSESNESKSDSSKIVSTTDSTKSVSLNSFKASVLQNAVSVDNTSVNSLVNNSTALTAFCRRKTLDLDKKYYNSMRIFLTEGKIIGYPEDSFTEEAKKFKIRKGKLVFRDKEVIETEELQQEIAIDFHLNSSAKSHKSRHRGIAATVRAIESKYFWGTVKFDVENVINKCRVCNPKEYDLTSHQLWKYIEIGVIEEVLIVRDLKEKSSIFKSAFLEDINPLKLSKYLTDLFKTYGTPNAIRIVLDKALQKRFTEELSEYLRSGLLRFIEEVESVSQNSADKEVIKLPMVDIKIEFDPNKCPKSEKELEATYAITTDEDISLFYIFSCSQWLISAPILNNIASDIKHFAQNSDWKSRVSSLTLYFQVKGINLKANEVEEEETIANETDSKPKKPSQLQRELERLNSDFKPWFQPNEKRQNKGNDKKDGSDSAKETNSSKKKNSDELSDSESSLWSDSSSSKRSHSSTKMKKKKKEPKEKENHSNSFKEQPFKKVLREQTRLSGDSIEVIDIDDESQQSVLSHKSSVASVSSEPKPNEPIVPTITQNQNVSTELEKYDKMGSCEPCLVIINEFSLKDIEKAIEGKYDFKEVITSKEFQPNTGSQEIMFSEESNMSAQEMENNSSPDSGDTALIEAKEPQKSIINDIINEELQKRSKVIEIKSSINLSDLSEESSSDDDKNEEKSKPTPKSKVETTPKLTTTVTQVKPSPKQSTTPAKTRTPVPARSQPKRKRSVKNSDNDSDYDVSKDRKDLQSRESSLSANKKRVKFNSNSKSNEKKKSNQISRKVIGLSSQSDSESEDNSDDKRDDNMKNMSRNDSTKNKAKTTNSNNRNSVTTTPITTTQVFKCTFCEFQTNEKPLYIMHSGKHRDERKNPILCPDCMKTFYTKDSLERHKEEEHPPVIHNSILYGCELCKQFGCYSTEESDEHMMSHIEDLSYMKTSSSKHRCSICKVFTASTRELMSTHMSSKHRMFKCAFDCSVVAPEFQTLQRHAKSIHPRYGNPFECKYCEFDSAVFGALVQHRKTSHALDWLPPDQNKCLLCEQHFPYDETNPILEHLSTHSLEFPYFECKSCSKRCRKIEQLRKHCETHHAVGPAEGLEQHIGNLSQLFDDLRKQLANESNKLKKSLSNANETQNAIAGLMDEQFEDNPNSTETDILATAFDSAFNDTEMDGGVAPTISIPDNEENEDNYGYIDEDEEGNWNPVTF